MLWAGFSYVHPFGMKVAQRLLLLSLGQNPRVHYMVLFENTNRFFG